VSPLKLKLSAAPQSRAQYASRESSQVEEIRSVFDEILLNIATSIPKRNMLKYYGLKK